MIEIFLSSLSFFTWSSSLDSNNLKRQKTGKNIHKNFEIYKYMAGDIKDMKNVKDIIQTIGIYKHVASVWFQKRHLHLLNNILLICFSWQCSDNWWNNAAKIWKQSSIPNTFLSLSWQGLDMNMVILLYNGTSL